MSRCLRGMNICIGVDDNTAKAIALQQQKVQAAAAASSSGGGTSWTTIAGMVLAIVATVALAPKIIKWVG